MDYMITLIVLLIRYINIIIVIIYTYTQCIQISTNNYNCNYICNLNL